MKHTQYKKLLLLLIALVFFPSYSFAYLGRCILITAISQKEIKSKLTLDLSQEASINIDKTQPKVIGVISYSYMVKASKTSYSLIVY